LTGKRRSRFSCGAITKSPGIKLTHDETLFKQCEIECILKNGADWSALDALYTLAATSSFTDATFSLASVQTVPYTVALTGVGAPWDAIYTMGGIEADFDLKTNPVMVSGYGMVDRKINALEITVKLTPVGLTVDQVLTRLKLQGTGVAMGQDLSAGAANITVSGGTGNPLAIFNNCRLKESVFQYGPSSLRLGEIPFIVTRPSGTGALYSLGVAA
jgi:hypothetical protein